MVVFVGGIGLILAGDLDVGSAAIERLRSEEPAAPGVVFEELYAGVMPAAERIRQAAPDFCILIAGEPRGGPPGEIRRRFLSPMDGALDPGIPGEVSVGYSGIDLLIDILKATGSLPERTVTIEVEPATLVAAAETWGSPFDSGAAEAAVAPQDAALADVCEAVRRELRRIPLIELAERVRPLLPQLRSAMSDQGLDASPAFEALRDLLNELAVVEHEGSWGRAFELCSRLRGALRGDATGAEIDQMDHLEWSQVWMLLEELDRLEKMESA